MNGQHTLLPLASSSGAIIRMCTVCGLTQVLKTSVDQNNQAALGWSDVDSSILGVSCTDVPPTATDLGYTPPSQ